MFAELLQNASQDPAEFVLGGIRIILGVAMALNGWAEIQGRNSVDLKNTARIKNLYWVFGGALSVLLVNWKPFFGKDDVQNGKILAIYIMCFIVSLLISLAIIMTIIEISIFLRRDLRKAGFDLALEYLHYGYKAYVAQRDETARIFSHDQSLKFNNSLALSASRADRLERRLNQREALGAILAMYFSKRYPKEHIRRSIFKFIEAELYGISNKPDELNVIRINYMRFIPISQASAEIKNRNIAKFGDEERYIGYLLLQDSPLSLPVDNLGSPTLLPGAPEAFVNPDRRACFDPKKIPYRKDIPEAVRKEGNAYFARAEFAHVRSVTSIAVAGEREQPIGVLNIDTNRPEMLGEGPDALKAACQSLVPSLILLAMVEAIPE